jgi:RecB family exonuclease
MTHSPAPWSFSRIKAFQTCPKQFYHVNVLKQFPFRETEATRYGTAFHLAAEQFIRDGAPLPPEFAFAQAALEWLAALPGEKLCEYRLGLTDRLEPCAFDAPDVWFRGIVDLAIIDGDRARIVDYKSGASARYADKGQLELMAMAMFRHFPQLKHIKAGLFFVIARNLTKAEYTRSETKEMWQKWLADYDKMAAAFSTGVWNPKPSGLCKRHCPVTECPHHGDN